jgi:hypothetical protein
VNPYQTFSDLLFTCVDGPKTDVVNTVIDRFNQPDKWSTRDANGMSILQYFVKDTEGIVSLPYIDKAERDTTKPNRIVFWEPRVRPGTTVLMGLFHDGLSHSIFRLSEYSPYTWINIRIYNDIDYPGCFFDYYADHRKTQRRLMACKDEKGWEFVHRGPVQFFENVAYYSKRMIKDRLNREIITEYLEKLGYAVSNEGFWETTTSASLLWQERPSVKT